MDILLETERLTLHRFTTADVQNIYQLDNDPAVMRYINGGTPTGLSVIQDEIMPTLLQYDDCTPVPISPLGFWAIIEKSTSAFLGWVGLRPVGDEADTAALGYRLCRRAWGNGYATEAARALIDKGFATTHLARIFATTYEENVASQRVMQKAGMTFVRRFRYTEDDLAEADTFHTEELELWDGDDVEFAVTRAAWHREHRK